MDGYLVDIYIHNCRKLSTLCNAWLLRTIAARISFQINITICDFLNGSIVYCGSDKWEIC